MQGELVSEATKAKASKLCEGDQDPKRVAFAVMMVKLAEAYNHELTSTLIEVYWSALKRCSFDAVRQKAWNHLQTEPRFPRICHLMSPGEKYRQKWLQAARASRHQSLEDQSRKQDTLAIGYRPLSELVTIETAET